MPGFAFSGTVRPVPLSPDLLAVLALIAYDGLCVRVSKYVSRLEKIGNKLVDGAKLVVMAGGGEMTQFGGAQQRQAVDSLVAGNSGPLVIGQVVQRRANKAPAQGTIVEGHDGPIEKQLEIELSMVPRFEAMAPLIQVSALFFCRATGSFIAKGCWHKFQMRKFHFFFFRCDILTISF